MVSHHLLVRQPYWLLLYKKKQNFGGFTMKDLASLALLAFFTIGLIITFVFTDGGFSSDMDNIQTKTQGMLTDAQTNMDTYAGN